MQSNEKVTCNICGEKIAAFPQRWLAQHMRAHVEKGEAVEVKELGSDNSVCWLRAVAGQVVPIPEELRFRA